MRITVFSLAVLGVAFAVGPVPTYADITSEYYFTNIGGDLHQNVVVAQGTSVIRAWPFSQLNHEWAIAVNDTVRTMGYGSGILGAEYRLGGTPTGATYSHNLPEREFFDGTTDGQFNYAWDYRGGAAYRFDLDWANPQMLFNLPTERYDRLGITYDPWNDSLWISGWKDLDVVENRSMDGELLSSFTVGHTYSGALALDYADGTLWLYDWNISGRFEQWSRDGNLLDTLTLSGVWMPHGGEFRIPAPGAALLAVLGLSLVGWVKRRKA